MAMLPNLGRLRFCPTGAREEPNPNPGTVESSNPVFDALFGVAELRERLFPNVLDKLFKGTDPEDVCAQALHWMNLHPSNAAAARNNPGAWMRLVSGVFGASILAPGKVGRLFPELADNEDPFPDYWQEVFLKLCGRYKQYLNGERKIASHMVDRSVFALLKAALTRNSQVMGFVRSDPWSEEQMAELERIAVQDDWRSLYYIEVDRMTRELVDIALAQDKRAIRNVVSVDLLIAILRERPELLRYELHRSILPQERAAILRALLEEDGSVFSHLPFRQARRHWLEIALQSFPWALEFVPAGLERNEQLDPATRSNAEAAIATFDLSTKTEEQRSNRHYVTEVIRRAPLQLEHVGKIYPFSADVELAWLAVGQDVRAIDYVDILVLANPEFMRRFNVKYGSSNYWRARIAEGGVLGEEAQKKFDWFASHYIGWANNWNHLKVPGEEDAADDDAGVDG
ncbi:MAG: hypothetical protein CMB11_09530 [Euryarchaeota archaeon]|nr:hypothetical protein [Euryarchaeota archaeon]